MEDWSSISHLYIWPESDRFKQVDESSRSLVYTIPIIKSDQQLIDEIPETVEKIRGYKFSRKSVSPDVNGLKVLIKEGNLKSAFNLTTTIFKSLGYGSTTDKRPAVTFDVMKVWNCRFQLLMALKLHRLAVDEMSAFEELDAPDLYFQYYAENRARGLSGTIVPFNLRLIQAEILQYTPTPWNSWNRLSKLEENVKSILNGFDLQTHVRDVWNQRLEAVKLAQGRLLFSLKEYQQCMSFYKEIALNTPDQQRAKHLRRFMVRLAMVMGNSGPIDELAECEDLDPKWTKCMRYIFTSNYEKATELLKSTDGMEACNNQSICALYNGDVKKSMDLLLGYQNLPCIPLLLNLYTIAELSGTKASDLRVRHLANFVDQLPDLFEPKTMKIVK